MIQTGSFLCLELALDSDPPTYVSYVAEITDTCHHTHMPSLLVKIGVLLTFCPELVSDYDSSNCFQRSWNYRCEPLGLVKNLLFFAGGVVQVLGKYKAKFKPQYCKQKPLVPQKTKQNKTNF
jgi:hypothetical protein